MVVVVAVVVVGEDFEATLLLFERKIGDVG